MDYQNRPVYIANMGLITSIGDTTDRVYAATKAGINGYVTANYHTHDHQSMVLALVPDDALPELSERLTLSGKISFRDRRILRMSLLAAKDAMQGFQGEKAIPVIFSAPEHYAGLNNAIDVNFLKYFIQQSGLPIDAGYSRLMHTGRTGAIDALKLADQYLYELNFSHVLIGSGDSCQHSEFLELMDADSRVKARRTNPAEGEDAFSPGEGAGFLLITRDPRQALRSQQYRIRLDQPGFGQEPGHLYSQQSSISPGLDQAVKQALANRKNTKRPIECIYSSMNGENFWSKEFGVMLSRNQSNLSDQIKILHPAENYGDIAAASAAGLIQMAHSSLMQSSPSSCLVCASSDHGNRAAICMTSESIAA
jgi:3-oxoacyl-[acyl-carrier-protein] synthase I